VDENIVLIRFYRKKFTLAKEQRGEIGGNSLSYKSEVASNQGFVVIFFLRCHVGPYDNRNCLKCKAAFCMLAQSVT
ncbi:MAG: hypothetical protein Q4F40_09710, partial [Akkermansia sp.]|nr:hypothetical protein [Akkermansia sp.]